MNEQAAKSSTNSDHLNSMWSAFVADFTTKRIQRGAALDPIGTSQNRLSSLESALDSRKTPLLDEIKVMRERQRGEKCWRNSPLICVPPTATTPGRVFQGCCNDWRCPRCGMLRANREFARISKGVADLTRAGCSFTMITYTCTGTITTEAAEADYLRASNNLKTSLRKQVKDSGGEWYYAEVTERQRRGHPHSHMICTFKPTDAYRIDNPEGYTRYLGDVERLKAHIPASMWFRPKSKYDPEHKKKNSVSRGEMFSFWLSIAAVKAGLGVQVNISEVLHERSVVTYLAKYMFKSATAEKWPKGWKRIRYSQSWPKLDEAVETDAFALLRHEDWMKMRAIKRTIMTDDPRVYEICLLHECMNVKCTVENEIDLPKKQARPEWKEVRDRFMRQK